MRSLEPGPRLALTGLVLANLVPLIGVVWFGWNIHALVVIYWLESASIGVASVAKIRCAQGEDDPDMLPSLSFNDKPIKSFVGQSNRRIAIFFAFHYGAFWVVHGVFVLVFFGLYPGLSAARPGIVAPAAGALFVHHAVSYRVNYIGEREYEQNGPVTLMVEPYRRVIVLHFTILLGAFAVAGMGAPVGALIVMVVVKTALDVRAHLKEHDRAQRPTPLAPTTPE